jgi:catechol 2,3-dioxygenase-like lactoylglutathione lyase family enzyme
MPGIVFEGTTPILRVRNLALSLSYYVDVLGFRVDWQSAQVASVSRGRCNLFLCEGDQGHPGVWVWIGVSDAYALFEELTAKGAHIRHPPTNYPWAFEMQVQDPDGNILRLGSEPSENEPVGEWLDMAGRRWIPVPGGGWTRADEPSAAIEADG